MNKLSLNLFSSLIGVLLVASFSSAQASQLSLVTSPQKMVAAVKTLAQYVPSKELIAQVSKSALIKSKSLITFSNLAAYFGAGAIVINLEQLAHNVPFLNQFKFLFKNRVFNVALQAAGIFALKKMNVHQIRFFIGMFVILHLLVDKYESMRKLKYYEGLINKIRSTLVDTQMKIKDQETLHKRKVENLLSQLEEVKKQRELLRQELATLNRDLSFELNIADEKICLLLKKIKIILEEKNELANALTALNNEWTINDALDELIIDEFLKRKRDSQFNEESIEDDYESGYLSIKSDSEESLED